MTETLKITLSGEPFAEIPGPDWSGYVSPSGDIYIGDPPRKRDTRPAVEQIHDLLVSYDPEWHNPTEIAERIIKIARRRR